jgi:hypothetical protein
LGKITDWSWVLGCSGRWLVIVFGLMLSAITFVARLMRFLWIQRSMRDAQLAQYIAIQV